MSTAKPRRPFTAETGDAPPLVEEDTVLDEQQQEDVVQTLTDENQQSNSQWIQILKIFMLCGLLVNVVGLVLIIQASAEHREPILFTGEPIPVAPAFALLSVVLTGICYNITGNPRPLPYFAKITHEHLTFVSLAAPALSFFLARHRSQTLWWFSETALIGVCTTAYGMIVGSEGEQGPEGLNKLKYEYKGA
ncbi:hypothetical protein CALCODRAFT_483328 [Calocera cornea HHB12733]|uniref:Uncharacterized protein n=1 Tax=Calocera cornea HHB12733 TaxID=1353952 RepID=A0A165FVJ3_9BASI|nr:hypothetical protein CALCODRAFT_483328 [Calocera cornea HHB12733]